jgi:hypothetical protein
MKTIASIIILVLSSNSASASWYQTTCTTADGMTRSANGHSSFYTIITKVEYDKENNRIETPIELDYDNYDEKIIETKELISENSSNCDEETGYGYSNWRNVNFQKLVITKRDGGLFSENISGVSRDRKSVTADMICEEEGNSQMFCGE